MDLEKLLVELAASIGEVSVEQSQAAFDTMMSDPFWGGLWEPFQFLWNLLFGITSGIASIIELLFRIIGDLPYVTSVITDFLVNIPQYFSWLPPQATSLLCVIFGVVATYMIVGRS